MLLQSIISNPDTPQSYVYAETAFHHEGSLAYLEELIDAAARSGSNGIKFQLLLDPNSVYSEKLPHIDRIRSWCFGPEQWLGLINMARDLGLDVIAMPIDMESVAFALEHQSLLAATEIHSICFNEYPMLEALHRQESPVLLNIGGRTVDEIETTLGELSGIGAALVYGLQNFPTDPYGIHLARIAEYKRHFSRIMGYADHTTADKPELGTLLSCHAYVMGCRIFERHITTQRGTQRIDHEAAVLPTDIRAMIEELDRTARILGDGSIHELTDRDTTYRRRQKQIVFARDMSTGEQIGSADLTFMVTPDVGDFDQISYPSLIGKHIAREVARYAPVLAGDVES